MTRVSIALGLLLLGCGTPGRNEPVHLPDATEPPPYRLIALDVGHLLSADPHESGRAEARLMGLDEESRQALLQHAQRIPKERDPRWLHVLEENHALGTLPPTDRLEYLLWKVSRPEAFYVTKAQAQILELARTRPEMLLERLDRGGRGTEAIAVALAMAGDMRVVPPLLARYRAARSPDERRVAAEALALLVGEERRPCPQGNQPEIERDARIIEIWYRDKTREANDA